MGSHLGRPPTYERIIKNIKVARVTIHCTITSQIAERPGYLDEFLSFWSRHPEIVKVWFSIFTPRRGATDREILTPSQRIAVIADLSGLRVKYPKLDMAEAVIHELESPPRCPEDLAPEVERPKRAPLPWPMMFPLKPLIGHIFYEVRSISIDRDPCTQQFEVVSGVY